MYSQRVQNGTRDEIVVLGTAASPIRFQSGKEQFLHSIQLNLSKFKLRMREIDISHSRRRARVPLNQRVFAFRPNGDDIIIFLCSSRAHIQRLLISTACNTYGACDDVLVTHNHRFSSLFCSFLYFLLLYTQFRVTEFIRTAFYLSLL